jgi:hypothetical protein
MDKQGSVCVAVKICERWYLLISPWQLSGICWQLKSTCEQDQHPSTICDCGKALLPFGEDEYQGLYSSLEERSTQSRSDTPERILRIHRIGKSLSETRCWRRGGAGIFKGA